jgi:hypothetical protein
MWQSTYYVQLQPPPAVMQHAATYRLGAPIAEYKYRAVGMIVSASITMLAGIFFLSLYLMNSTGTSYFGGDSQSTLVFGLVALAFLAIGVWLFVKTFLERGSHVYVFNEGLLRMGARMIAIRWDSVESVWQAVTRRYANGIYTGTRHLYTVRQWDGTKTVFNDQLKNVEALGNTIARETLRILLPRVIEAYRAGSTITFGPLSVSQQGVSNGRELLPWNQIKGIEIRRGIVTVKKEGKWLSWSSVRVPNIPNFFVFNALVDYVITAK